MKLSNKIRKATRDDLSRVAEIYVFTNRLLYWPIFQDDQYSFQVLQVETIIDNYFSKPNILEQLYIYDDGLVKGFIQVNNLELVKIYVDYFFQRQKIGNQLLEFAIKEKNVEYLWALQKNKKAQLFYQKNGFKLTDDRQFEEGTVEYLIKYILNK